mgnify:CR=1 FL=1
MRPLPISANEREPASARARGFTLLETILASVIGSFVLLGCFSLFLSMSRVENSMNRASRQMEELAMTQQILRKSFMTIALIGEQALEAKQSELAVDGVIPVEQLPNLPRPRFIVEFDNAPSIAGMVTSAFMDGVELRDPSGFDSGPQFIEIVLPDKPVPESMRLFVPRWSSSPTDDLVEAFDPSGISRPQEESGVRGIFELRPGGARERVMEGYGVTPATGLEPRPLTPDAREAPDGWTLWWRPVYGEEYAARQTGVPFDVDSNPTLLEEAVPLIRGVRRMQVYAFAAEEDPANPDGPPIRERYPAYDASTTAQLPGFVEFIIETTGGLTAEWVFEMGWSITDESFGDPAAPEGGENPEGGADGSPAEEQLPDDTGLVGERS